MWGIYLPLDNYPNIRTKINERLDTLKFSCTNKGTNNLIVLGDLNSILSSDWEFFIIISSEMDYR